MMNRATENPGSLPQSQECLWWVNLNGDTVLLCRKTALFCSWAMKPTDPF